MSNQRKRLNEEERDEDDEEEEGIGEWERAYADDKSWEGLEEDESGLLRPIDNSAIYHAQYRRRLRMLSAAAAGTRIQKGLIRYLCIVIDFSQVPALLTLNDPRRKLEKSCFGCQQSLFGAGNNKPGPCVTCRKCKHYFCLDCDIYIHESLHNCPGCESIH